MSSLPFIIHLKLQLSFTSAISVKGQVYGMHEVHEFFKKYSISNSDKICNAYETGYPRCFKSQKVLAMRGSKDDYKVTGNSKER